MINPVTEMRIEYKGYPCVVLFTPMGHRCGYVGLPETHPCYGKHYSEVDIKCHGGLTYSREHLYNFKDEGVWWLGFDCAHFMDNPDIDTLCKRFPEHPELVEARKRLVIPGNVVRKIDYVMGQCGLIADQLKELEGGK